MLLRCIGRVQKGSEKRTWGRLRSRLSQANGTLMAKGCRPSATIPEHSGLYAAVTPAELTQVVKQQCGSPGLGI
jgi:hypothetical protein